MIETLIVDDEIYVRLGLASMINWEQLGFSIVGQAGNGEAGLELALSLKPQLIITDIRMPVMDGLTFVRKLRERGDTAKIIVLSLYEDFHKMRDASRLGIFDYLLKSELVDTDKLTGILLSVKKEIESIHGAGKNSRNALQTSLIHELSHTFDPYSETASFLLSELSLSDCKSYILVLYSLDDYNLRLMRGDRGQNEKNVISRTVQYIAGDVAGGDPYCVIGPAGENIFACVVFGDGSEALAARADAFISGVKKEVFKLIEYDVFAASSGVLPIPSLHECFPRVLPLLNSRMFFSDSYKVTLADVRAKTDYRLNHGLTSAMLSKCFDLGDEKGACTLLDDILLRGVQESFDAVTADNVSLELYGIIRETIKMNCLLDNEDEISSIDILRFDTLRKRRDFLAEKLMSALRKREGGGDMCKRIIGYFNENYQHSISLQEIANFVNMSPSYVSHLYKKSSGESLIDTLTRIRLQNAKKLLTDKNQNLKIYEISDRVGLENPRYFSQLFKKVIGCTPVEYRAKHVDD